MKRLYKICTIHLCVIRRYMHRLYRKYADYVIDEEGLSIEETVQKLVQVQ